MVPHLNSVSFPNGLHTTGAVRDTATVQTTVIAPVNIGDTVNITCGLAGLAWQGTIQQKPATNTGVSNNLLPVAVRAKSQDDCDEEDDDAVGSGTENVSTTVTNSDGQSNAVTTTAVPIDPP